MKIFKNIKELNKVLKPLINKKIVFTNGVFDIIHPGHIELFEFAKKNGDLLIVGINDDDSVKNIKGKNRPIFNLNERMELLEAIEYIDYIIPFSQDTPIDLINKLFRIDVLVKGGDYKPDEVKGKKEVERTGGKLLLFKFHTNYSTSSIIKKIKNQT